MGDTSVLPSYSDRKVEAGKSYRYQVAALDAAGNESERSAAVTAAL
jgi:fibronectin type 3 domain-containing protein